MRRTPSHYALIIVSAALLAVLPAALVSDLLAPLNNWNSYELANGRQRHPYSPAHQPLALRSELFLFKLLVVPPGFARKVALGSPTVYADAWISSPTSDGSQVLGLFPPLVFARENAAWAFPLWLLIGILSHEAVVRLKRQTAGAR